MCKLAQISLINFPGRVAATLYLPGCNLRCPYCHNNSLVNKQIINEEAYLSFIESKKKYISGVCITGGEPLFSFENTLSLIKKIKSMGLFIKLDTNGFFPKHLAQLISHKMIDYVAMDIKTSPKSYPKATGCKMRETQKIKESVALIRSSYIEHEFRSTVVPTLYTKKDAYHIGKWLSGCKKYILQPFSNKGPLLDPLFKGIQPYSLLEMNQIKSILSPYIKNIQLRGVA